MLGWLLDYLLVGMHIRSKGTKNKFEKLTCSAIQCKILMLSTGCRQQFNFVLNMMMGTSCR